MALRPDEEIGAETHLEHDQFVRLEKGKGELWIAGEHNKIERDDAIIVPAGDSHNTVNTGSKSLKLYARYAPPQQRHGVPRATKADAAPAEEHFDGKTTEAAASAEPASYRGARAKPSA